MHFFIDYILFAAKFITVMLVLLVFIGLVLALAAKSKGGSRSELKVKVIGEHFEQLRLSVTDALDDDAARKQIKQERKARAKLKDQKRQRLFVLDFKGDIKAKATTGLKEQINAVYGLPHG